MKEGGRAYPAPGNRLGGNGMLYFAGMFGLSWSSMTIDNRGYYLDFGNERISPQGSNNRGYGFQVRCLQE